MTPGKKKRIKRAAGPSGMAAAIGFLGFVSVPLLLAGFSETAPAEYWTEAAAAAGMTAMAAFVAQFASSGRYRHVTGRIGIDLIMSFHKWLAPVALLLAFAHIALLASPGDLASVFRRSWNMLSSQRLWDGSAALTLSLGLVLLALNRNRLPVGYGAWRLTHLLLAFAVVVIAMRHVLHHGTYATDTPLKVWWISICAAAVATPLAFHMWRRFCLRPWKIKASHRVAEGLWEVTLERDGPPLAFAAGQFAWLRLRSEPPWNDNPFSIVSAPGHKHLTFLIGEAGDMTARIGKLPPGTEIAVDGPHGAFTLERESHDNLLLVAGGVGIAPILSILESLAETPEGTRISLLYAGSERARILAPSRLKPVLRRLAAKSVFLADDAGAGDPDFLQGPLNETHLAACMKGLDPDRTVAMICGPAGMTTHASDLLHKSGMPLRNIRYERFSYDVSRPSTKDVFTMARFLVIVGAIAALALAFAFRQSLLG